MATGYYPVANKGERVLWETKHAHGEGIFALCWLGIEEAWDIVLDNGRTIHLYPCFGDTVQPVTVVFS